MFAAAFQTVFNVDAAMDTATTFWSKYDFRVTREPLSGASKIRAKQKYRFLQRDDTRPVGLKQAAREKQMW